MTNRTTEEIARLTELAERCEKATGPDRDIDGWIWAHVKRGERYVIGAEPGRFPQKPIYGERADVMRDIGGNDGAEYIGAPLYTSSLDAAMTLVPEGWRIASFGEHRCGGWDIILINDADSTEDAYQAGRHRLSAPALTAACLRALAVRSHLESHKP